jgi:hypothetical protein
MITTLTTEQAIELVPAIGAIAPSERVSDRYQFVSSRNILDRVQEHGWRITNATAQSGKTTAQHRVTLVHETDLAAKDKEGMLRIEMFNSHDRTKRLMFAIGYFRLICSNGLLIASGPAETIRTKHRFTDDKLSEILDQVTNMSSRFPSIINTIEQFKSRTLTDNEQASFAEYAVRGRFNYRPQMPKRYTDLQYTTNRMLTSRRPEDASGDTWQVYNRVQENLVRGVEGFSRPIKGYIDNIRVNQLLWKGAETTLNFEGDKLRAELSRLLTKDGEKGKISA